MFFYCFIFYAVIFLNAYYYIIGKAKQDHANAQPSGFELSRRTKGDSSPGPHTPCRIWEVKLKRTDAWMESIVCPFLRSSICEEAQRRLDQTGLASEEGTLEQVAGIEAFEHAIDKTGPGDPRQSLRRQRGQAEANLDFLNFVFLTKDGNLDVVYEKIPGLLPLAQVEDLHQTMPFDPLCVKRLVHVFDTQPVVRKRRAAA